MNKKNNDSYMIIVAALLCWSLCLETARGISSTPFTGMTGAPGHGSCVDCHSGSGVGNVGLTFSGGTEYEIDRLYSMIVTVTDPGQLRFGFSMVARDVDDELVDVGTWSIAPGSTDTQVHGPMTDTHISHKNAPFAVDTHSFEVNWTAPSAAVGDVKFYVVGIGANGNGNSDDGDHVYLQTLTISESVATNLPPSFSVPGGSLNVTSEFPSPITGIFINDADAGGGDLTVNLSVESGVLSVADSVSGGVGANDISGNGSTSVTLIGTLTELSAIFNDPNGVIYQSNGGFLGSDTLQLVADDNGNTGGGGPQTGNATISISVNSPPGFSNLLFLPNGNFQLTLTGVPGLTYIVEHSENLVTWELQEEVTLVFNTATITDSNAPSFSSRFYRVAEKAP